MFIKKYVNLKVKCLSSCIKLCAKKYVNYIDYVKSVYHLI